MAVWPIAITYKGECDMSQEMMRAAVLTGPKQIEVKNVPVPELEPGMIEIKVCNGILIL